MKRPTENVKNAMNKMISEYWNKPIPCTKYEKLLRELHCCTTFFEDFVIVRFGKFEDGTPAAVIEGIRTGKIY